MPKYSSKSMLQRKEFPMMAQMPFTDNTGMITFGFHTSAIVVSSIDAHLGPWHQAPAIRYGLDSTGH